MAINVQKTKGFPCNKILPLTFDDSLSYYEMVCKLLNIIEDIQESGTLKPEDWEELNNLKQIAQNADNVYEGALLGKTSLQPFVSHLSELIEDTNHRTTTDEEKATWSGKQNALGFTPENVANKVTGISEFSTDSQYPTAKAVYSYIQSLDGNGVNY